jgi:hypothetical protein
MLSAKDIDYSAYPLSPARRHIMEKGRPCGKHASEHMRCIMAKTEVKHFDKPDEVRTFPKGKLELIKVGGATVGRAVFEPGWKWSTAVKPIAKTKSCEAPHFQYHVAGILHVRMDDGSEFE